MKFLRFLCNLLLFVALSVGISVAQTGVYDIIAAQSKDIDPVYISSNDETNVNYTDLYSFWATDIATNYKQDAKYRVRNWIGGDFWKSGMEWADIAVDAVVATAKPIFVPIAQVNAVKNYYYNNIDTLLLPECTNKNVDDYNNKLYELYILFKDYSQPYGSAFELAYADGDAVITTTPISEFVYFGDYSENGDYSDNEITKAEYGRWVARNKLVYNHNWKLNKYNSPEYTNFYNKFVTSDGHIKTAIIILYYQQYVSLILAFIFVCKFPVTFVQYSVTGKKRRGHLDDLTK